MPTSWPWKSIIVVLPSISVNIRMRAHRLLSKRNLPGQKYQPKVPITQKWHHNEDSVSRSYSKQEGGIWHDASCLPPSHYSFTSSSVIYCKMRSCFFTRS